MTVKEQIIRRVLDMDEAEAEATLTRLIVASPIGNGHRHDADGDSDVWATFLAERDTSVRNALAKPPGERTPFEHMAIDGADRRARLAGTPQLAAEEADTRASIEAIAAMPPITLDDPLWNMIGALSGGPDSPGDVAENHDFYLAEAYADTHEEQD